MMALVFAPMVPWIPLPPMRPPPLPPPLEEDFDTSSGEEDEPERAFRKKK